MSMQIYCIHPLIPGIGNTDGEKIILDAALKKHQYFMKYITICRQTVALRRLIIKPEE
jgi:hypothetical protein